MRLLPRSLFGRLVLVLLAGLVLAQLLSAAISISERDQTAIQLQRRAVGTARCGCGGADGFRESARAPAHLHHPHYAAPFCECEREATGRR